MLKLTKASYLDPPVKMSSKLKCSVPFQKAGEGSQIIVDGKRMRGRRYLVINPSHAIITPSFRQTFYHSPSSRRKKWVRCVFGGSFPRIEWWLWARGGNRLWSYLGPAPRGLNRHSTQREKEMFAKMFSHLTFGEGHPIPCTLDNSKYRIFRCGQSVGPSVGTLSDFQCIGVSGLHRAILETCDCSDI